MNVLLVQPRCKQLEVSYPLGLAYLSASLKAVGHKTFGIDCAFNSSNRILKSIEENNINFVAFSCNSYNYSLAVEISRIIRNAFEIPMVFGGPHCTLFPAEVIKETSIDYVITGEGDQTIVEFASKLGNKNFLDRIASLVYKGNGCTYNISPINAIVENISDLPFPDRDIFPVASYFGTNSKYSHYTQIIIS